MDPRRARVAVEIVALAVIYTLVARAGLALDAVGGFAAAVWPPSGLALAALFLRGHRLAPGVFVGAVTVNLWMGAPVAAAAGIAVGNTAEALVAVLALRRLGFSPSLARVRDVVALAVVGAVLSTIVSASFGVLSLRLLGTLPAERSWDTFVTWWVGDALGDLLIAPLLLVVGAGGDLRARRFRPSVEGVVAFAVLLAVGAFVFGTATPPKAVPLLGSFLVFPPLIWIALRVGPGPVAAASLLTATIAIAGTAAGAGPFGESVVELATASPLSERLVTLQIFMGVVATTMLVLGAAVAERAHAERAVRESYALLRAMIDGTDAPVYAKDRNGRFIFVNDSAARVFGHPAEALIGKDDAALARTRLRDLVSDATLLDAPGPRTEEDTVELGGRTRTFAWTRGAYRDGNGAALGTVGIARDITAHKESAAALEAAVRARDEFMFIAGHELRTPLCTLTLELGSLERAGRRNGLDERGVERVRKLLRQTDRLNHLVQSLLDVSRMATGRLVLKREDLEIGRLVAEVVDRFEETARQAGCTITLRAGAEAHGRWDRLRIEQIVTNLVANAVKYGAGNPVEITIAAGPTGVELSVRDQGMGIAEEDAARIFGPFERAVSVRHYGGLGLGLYVTRQIVEAHGGSIHVVSKLGDGATFVVQLPRASDAPLGDMPAPVPPPRNEKEGVAALPGDHPPPATAAPSPVSPALGAGDLQNQTLRERKAAAPG